MRWASAIVAMLVLGGEASGVTLAGPSAATGTIVAVRGAALVDGQAFTLADGAGGTRAFEFDANGSVTLGNIAVVFGPTDNANVIANRIAAAVNASPLAVTASSAGTAAVGLVNDQVGAAGNVPIAENVTAPEFTALGMSGGTDGGSDSPSAATGTIVAVRGSWLVDGETFAIADGAGGTMTFEFDGNGSVTSGNVAVVFGPTDNANVIANRILTAVNSTPLAVTAASAGTAAVGLVNDQVGAAGNGPIAENVSAPEFTALGMSGGKDETLAVDDGSSDVRARVWALPNPFRSTTTLQLGARAGRAGAVCILDVRGRVVHRLAAVGGLAPQIRWDGRDSRGQTLSPGVYFYEIHSAGAAPATGTLIKLQ
jgi:hypothetical protein